MFVDGYIFFYKIECGGWWVEFNCMLCEIFGIILMNFEQVMVIQDEKGIFYLFELWSGNIISEIIFDKDWDYEDFCLVGDYVFVFECDGDFYQFYLV